jgi:eukaryotic-like serine/threonine-protein kinase
MPLLPGQVLQNRYRILHQLGQGGFGTVFKAWDEHLQNVCAIKENLGTTPQATHQFQLEATLLAKLHHSNLPRVIDHFIIPGEKPGTPDSQYLVMDFVEGTDLQTRIEQVAGPLPEDSVLHWTEQICNALDYLHSQQTPVIHRDIKPSNIRVTPNGNAILVDFGIAKEYDPKSKTTIGARGYTPGYSPPEQYGRSPTDARTDIYALGATLYAVLTGQEPTESVQRTIGIVLTNPRMINPNISPYVEAAILKAMALNPAHRFQSTAELWAALNPIHRYQVTQSPSQITTQIIQDVAPAPTISLPSNKRVIQIVIAGAGVLIFAVLLFLFYIFGRASRSPGLLANAEATSTRRPTHTSAVEVGRPIEATLTPTLKSPIIVVPTIPSITPSVTIPSTWQQGRLVFVAQYNGTYALYLLDLAAGGEPVLLYVSSQLAWALAPQWSPNGNFIAFSEYLQGNRMLAVIDPIPGATPRFLQSCNAPTWSSNSSRLICQSPQDDSFIIFEVNSGAWIESFSPPAGAELPTWSPLGDKMAYVVRNGGQTSLWVSSLGSGSIPSLLAGTANENFAPSWSPDGQHLAFQSTQGSPLSDIWVINLDGTGLARVVSTNNAYWSRAPTWSPDGKWLAFVSSQAGSSGDDLGEIFVVSLTTGQVIQITNTGGAVYDWRVSWGP